VSGRAVGKLGCMVAAAATARSRSKVNPFHTATAPRCFRRLG
jgi:hypothetical protein